MRCVIVGGGITGLSAAQRLLDLGPIDGVPVDLRLLEAGPRLGGKITTERVDGYLVEGGPDKLLAQKTAARNLLKRLGMDGEIVTPDPAHAGIDVVHRGRLVRVPDGFMMMAPTRFWPTIRSPLFSVRGKLRMAIEPWIPPREDRGDESLASFVARRFGREVLDRVAEPVVGGVYLARARELSLRQTFPQFLEMERKQGSVLRAFRRAGAGVQERSGPRSAFFAPREGLGRIVDELLARIPGGWIRTNAPVERVWYDDIFRTWRLRCRDGRDEKADAVILACPGPAAGEMLRDHDRPLAARIGTLEYAPCATVTLAYPKSAIRGKLRGFGFFVPPVKKLPVIACSYDSLKFPGRAPADQVLLRVFLGGTTAPQVMDLDDTDLVMMADATVRRLLRIDLEAIFSRVHRFRQGMPQYPVGHDVWVTEIIGGLDRHPGLFVAGGPMGAAGVPDCIRSGESAAGLSHAYFQVLLDAARPQRDALDAGGSKMQAIP